MGQELSIPEQLYAAAKQDNTAWTEEALQRWQQQRRRPRSTADRLAMSILSWEDPTSRLTPLMLAAAKCRLEITRALLIAGADPNFVSRAPIHGPRGGTALHMAVKAHHTAVVDLLLHHGADPYLENAEGYTAMDIAVSEGDPLMLRRLECRALFAGYLMQKVPQPWSSLLNPRDSYNHTPPGAIDGGMSDGSSYASSGDNASIEGGEYRMRWVVIAPRISLPTGGRPAGTVRVELWTFEDWDDATPKTQVWLDGATAWLVQSESDGWVGRVRLHPDHREPVDPAGPYDGGWPLTFCPPSGLPLGTATLSAFTDCAARPLDYLAAASAALTSAVAAASSPGGPAAAAFAARGGMSGTAAPLVAAAAAAAAGVEGTRPTAGVGHAASTAGAVSIESAGHQERIELHRQLQATQLALCQLRLQQRRRHIEAQLQRLQQQQERLAPQVQPSGDNGGSLPSAHAPPRWTGRLQLPLQQGQDVLLVPAAAPPLSHLAPLANAAAASRRGGSGRSVGHSGPLPMPSLRSAPVLAATEIAPIAVQQLSPAGEGHPDTLQQLADLQAAAGQTLEASTHTRRAITSSLHQAWQSEACDATKNDGNMTDEPCVICLSKPRSVGFLHRDTVHRCVCTGCAPLVRVGGPCPLCREPIAAALRVY